MEKKRVRGRGEKEEKETLRTKLKLWDVFLVCCASAEAL